MLDRKTQPTFNALRQVSIPQVKSNTLTNGTPLFYIHHESTSVFKLELVLKAGSWYASDYHLVPLTLKMLNEGTKEKSSKVVAEGFDKLGSFFELTPGFDNCSVVVYGLSKFLEENLKLLEEVLFQPAFESNTFDSLKKREAQKLELSLEKSNYKASTRLRSNLFGTSHPYGILASPDKLRAVDKKAVEQYYHDRFGSFDVLLSGNLPDNFESLLDKYLTQSRGNLNEHSPTYTITTLPETKVEERNPKFVQSSIRLGRTLFNRSHEDYVDFMVLNEVLGGYFGSRLMKNIREDKGFTYGIHSQLYALNHSGYFNIGTDVNSDNEQETIDEIHYEIDQLRDIPVPDEELRTVKNYMTGTFAGSLSTPFSVMDKFKAVHYQGLDLTFFDAYIEKINLVSAIRLQALTNQYLKKENLSLVLVGS